MLRSKLARYTLSFTVIVIASAALYPAAQLKNETLIWTLLALISAAALLTLLKEN